MLALVDYGAGNLASVERALARLGADTRRVTVPEQLEGARAIVLPGVGHFAAMMRVLAARGLQEPIRLAVANGVPLLGICLGLQTLYAGSEEAPECTGLGLFSGTVRELPRTVKLPHMGWNQIRPVRPSRLLRGIAEAAWFYFAHAYAALDEGPHVCAVCEHGARFAAVVEQDHVMAVQFHPEKSGAAGLQVLRNFLEAIR
ncbi:MAG: imidazole glycerol phosphate synthase subunit HisH [Firmicutes bacterium]|nr:imidazole glycerol phosphate synthase subunit HisH [Bacillota bacterium]